MNRFATFSVIAALSTLSFGGITYATDAKMNWPSHIDQSVRAFKGDNVRIIDIDTLKQESQTRMWIDEASAQQRAALFAAVEANKPLATKLKAQNVEMNNIAGAEEAADGGLTIYVR